MGARRTGSLRQIVAVGRARVTPPGSQLLTLGTRAGHILQTTALVHEAFIKLHGQNRVQWQNRQHFYGLAALCMERVLFNYARKRQADEQLNSFSEVRMSAAQSGALLLLKPALAKLARVDRRKQRVVVLSYFGGYTMAEVSEILQVSEVTVARDLKFARAWLFRELGGV